MALAQRNTNLPCRRRVAAQSTSPGMTLASPTRPRGLSKSLALVCLSAEIGQIEGVSRRKYTEHQRLYWMRAIHTVPIFGA